MNTSSNRWSMNTSISMTNTTSTNMTHWWNQGSSALIGIRTSSRHIRILISRILIIGTIIESRTKIQQNLSRQFRTRGRKIPRARHDSIFLDCRRVTAATAPFAGERYELLGSVLVRAGGAAPEQDAQCPGGVGDHHRDCGGDLRRSHRQSGTGPRRAAVEQSGRQLCMD